LAQSLMNGGAGMAPADLQQQQGGAAAMLPYMSVASAPQQGLNGGSNVGNNYNGNSISRTSTPSYATAAPPAMLALPPGAGTAVFNPADGVATGPLPSWNSNSATYTTDSNGAGTAILPPVVQQESSTSSDALSGVVPDRPAIPLSMSCDDQSLSSYQCLVRQQVELFQATQHDIDANAQGRNRPIVLGQVGIRCRHCANLPPKARKSGAVYFPSKVRSKLRLERRS
jgi:hypothetical protein